MDKINIEKLFEIVQKLRVECPWDKKQTFHSLKAQTIEEVYEIVEAIDNNDFEDVKKELGDLLLHISFYAILGEEEKLFTINEVIDSICEKLIRRHPHVFGEKKLDNDEAVKQNWELTKMQEGRNSILEGVPQSLPGLQRAERLQDKASKVGFDWEKKEDVWAKVLEEINELKSIENKGNIKEIENEMGDILFSLVNYCRFLGINPENALRSTNDKFIKRFCYVEDKFKSLNKKIEDSTLEEMDLYWNESKKI